MYDIGFVVVHIYCLIIILSEIHVDHAASALGDIVFVELPAKGIIPSSLTYYYEF